eukprot:COSAG01_NODE_7589_length_3137_cov_1.470046_4_plen_208_part_00
MRRGVHVCRRGVEGGQVRGSTLRERVGHEAEALAPVCDLFSHQPTRGLKPRLWSEHALLLCTRAHPPEAIAHARHIGHTDAVEQLGGGWTVRQPWGTGAAPANELAHSQPASQLQRAESAHQAGLRPPRAQRVDEGRVCVLGHLARVLLHAHVVVRRWQVSRIEGGDHLVDLLSLVRLDRTLYLVDLLRQELPVDLPSSTDRSVWHG